MDNKVLKKAEIRRYARHSDIINHEKLNQWYPIVIGIGAVGRQVAIQLAGIGSEKIKLIDPDLVEEVNIGPQAYWEDDLKEPKVHSTQYLLENINGNIDIYCEQERFKPEHVSGEGLKVLFSCVDDIDTRKEIFESAYFDYWIDGRVGGEAIRVLTCDNSNEGRKRYTETLFPKKEAYEPPCTAKMTIYSANIAAGIMVSQLTKMLREIPPDHDLSYNILTSELSVD